MYANPDHIRTRRVNLSLNETEDRLVDAVAEFNGVQKSVLLRELAMAALRNMNGFDSAGDAEKLTGTHA